MPYCTRLTNTQAAYRFYHEDFMKRLRERAASLWDDGYRVTAAEGEPCAFLVYRDCVAEDETLIGDTHLVNPVAETCTCKFFTKQTQGEPLTQDGEQIPCKHLLGLNALVREELDYLTMRRDFTGDPRRELTYQQMIDALRDPWALAGK